LAADAPGGGMRDGEREILSWVGWERGSCSKRMTELEAEGLEGGERRLRTGEEFCLNSRIRRTMFETDNWKNLLLGERAIAGGEIVYCRLNGPSLKLGVL